MSGMANTKEAPWPVRWIVMAVGLSLVLLAPGLLVGVIERAVRNWSDEAGDLQTKYGADEDTGSRDLSPGTGGERSVSYSVDDLLLCPETAPTQAEIDTAAASPDLWDSPLNRLECDGWLLPDGSVLLTDGGQDRVAEWGVRTLEPSRRPGQIVPVRTGDVGAVIIPTAESSTSTGTATAPGDSPGLLSRGWSILWIAVKVGFLIALFLVVIVFTVRMVKWGTRGLRRQRVEASADVAEASGLRHAYPTVAASGTEPEDLDDLPMPPASRFPLPVGPSVDDDDDSDPTEGWS